MLKVSIIKKTIGYILGFIVLAYILFYFSVEYDYDSQFFLTSRLRIHNIEKTNSHSQISNQYVNISFIGKYITNGFPVQNIPVYLMIDNKAVYSQKTNQNGAFLLNYNLSISTAPILAKIVINIANEFKEDIPITLNTDIANVQNLVLDIGTKILKTNAKRNSQVYGCLLSESKKPIVDAEVQITYDKPILLEMLTMKTGQNGCFDFKATLPYFDIITAQLQVRRKDFYPFSTINNKEYPNGIVLQESFQYEFKNPIILKSAFAYIIITGVVLNQYSIPIAGVSVQMSIISGDKEIVMQTAPLSTVTDGSFKIELKLNYREDFSCEILVSKLGLTSTIKTFTLASNDTNFSKNITIQITPQIFRGSVSGVIYNKKRKPVSMAIITFSANVYPFQQVIQYEGKTDQSGVFMIGFNAYEGEIYNGNLKILSPGYTDQLVNKINLSEELNQFSVNNLEILLEPEAC